MSDSHTGGRGRQRVILVVIAAAVLVVLVAAGASFAGASGSPSPAADKITLRLGWNEGPLNLNPFIGYSASYEVWLLNYDTLVAVGADGLPSRETGLAEDWELSPDQKTWTFRIRPGVKWQDGEPLTARDVAFTFNTIIDNDMSLAIYLKDVKKAVAVDDTTLKVYCTEPKANMLLTQVYIYILPEHIWGKLDPKAMESTFRNPVPIVGSGPFQTVEFKKDDYVKLVRNPTFWGKQPTIDEVIFSVLHQHGHDGAGPQERHHRRRPGDPAGAVQAARERAGHREHRLPALQLGVHRRQLLRQPGLAGRSGAHGPGVPRRHGVGDRP